HRVMRAVPTRRSSDLRMRAAGHALEGAALAITLRDVVLARIDLAPAGDVAGAGRVRAAGSRAAQEGADVREVDPSDHVRSPAHRSEEHTSELQSRETL